MSVSNGNVSSILQKDGIRVIIRASRLSTQVKKIWDIGVPVLLAILFSGKRRSLHVEERGQYFFRFFVWGGRLPALEEMDRVNL